MLRAALILDGAEITQWQKDALDAARDLLDIKIVLSCTNSRTKKNLTKNFLYYLLNIVSLKNRLTRKVRLDRQEVPVVEFDSIYEGSWQRIPSSVSKEIADSNIDVIIKFGMSLLRIDEALSRIKILSFHHGDPSCFRGRPAGFYELLFRADSVGVIVQELSNKLDAGKVWAICHSKIQHHSYKKTAINFYANSRFLLRKALINLANNRPVDIEPNGKNYRLPGNLLVLKFFAILFARKLRRIIYGAFYEKGWNVGTAGKIEIKDRLSFDPVDIKSAKIPASYSFYADPFFGVDGSKIRVEALNLRSGLGEIVELDAENLTLLNILLKGNHYSYPFSFFSGNEEFLIPEVASHSSPYMLAKPFQDERKILLRGLEKYRIVDSTMLENEGRIYLFCGMNSSASDCLYLFSAEGVDKEFKPHPLNPIVMDPSRARMGGRIIRRHGRLYRFGQNNSFGYGDGISICEITKLSGDDYEEKIVGSLRFNDACGPHTVDVFEDKSVLDFYVDKFSLFAWYRRIVPYVLRRAKGELS
ncbi:MAG: hypothetical protein GXC94_03930 [Comamonadaceae bacterium]|nr:hypothetical protein [Comamonadaceae bacterium]